MLVALEVSLCAIYFQVSASTSFISGLSPCWLLAVLYCWPIRSPSSRKWCRKLVYILWLWNLVKILSFKLLINRDLRQFLCFQSRFYGNIGSLNGSYIILWGFSIKGWSKFHCWNCFLVAWISEGGCKSILWARSHCRMNKFLLINIFEVLVSRKRFHFLHFWMLSKVESLLNLGRVIIYVILFSLVDAKPSSESLLMCWRCWNLVGYGRWWDESLRVTQALAKSWKHFHTVWLIRLSDNLNFFILRCFSWFLLWQVFYLKILTFLYFFCVGYVNISAWAPFIG